MKNRSQISGDHYQDSMGDELNGVRGSLQDRSNIVLIGYRGAGKSTVGRRLAERLRKKFVDTDLLIEERLGTSIGDMVTSHGWEHFRAMEKLIIREASSQDNQVIAPGGGVILDPHNVMALRQTGFMIWLRADPQVLHARVKNDPQTFHQRPALVEGKDSLQELNDVMASRDALYASAAEVHLDTSTLNVEGVVESLLAILNHRGQR